MSPTRTESEPHRGFYVGHCGRCTPEAQIGHPVRVRAGLIGRWNDFLWGLALALGLAGVAVEAQPLTGGGFTLVGAPAPGGTLTGGSYWLTGYVAAAGADTSSGEDFDLTCGLIGIYGGSGDSVTLRAETTSTGDIRLWWSATAFGVRLESTTSVGEGAFWEPVSPAPSGNEYLTPPVSPARFYRLRQP